MTFKKRFNSIFEAACFICSAGYRWDNDRERFIRGSWEMNIRVQKNGKIRIDTH